MNFGADDTDNDFTNENLADATYTLPPDEISSNEMTQREFDKMAKNLESGRLTRKKITFNADGTVPYSSVVYPEPSLDGYGERPEDDDTVIDRYMRNRAESDEERNNRTGRKPKPKPKNRTSNEMNLDRLLSQGDANVNGRLIAPADEIRQRTTSTRSQQRRQPPPMDGAVDYLRSKQIELVELQIKLQKQLYDNAVLAQSEQIARTNRAKLELEILQRASI